MPACRAFAHRMNQVREADKHPDLAVHAGALYAMGLIDEASHVLMARYREQYDQNVMADAVRWFGSQVGETNSTSSCLPSSNTFRGRRSSPARRHRSSGSLRSTDGVPNREIALEELVMLWTANRNEAFTPFASCLKTSRWLSAPPTSKSHSSSRNTSRHAR